MSMMVTDNKIQLELAAVWMRDDGIIVVHITDERPIELADAQAIVRAEGELSGGRKVPVLHIIDKDSLPSKEVREYSASAEPAQYKLAEAYITKTLAQKLLGNFYVQFNKPSVPAKMFLREEDAIKWLKTFL